MPKTTAGAILAAALLFSNATAAAEALTPRWKHDTKG